ncbi:MAG: rhamnogalacturonan acetylesterase [Opitutaceae bacterium]|jgi:lysophospholipase L1-like esterase
MSLKLPLLLALGAMLVSNASAEGIKIALIGDSTVCKYPATSRQHGWGELLPEFFVSDTTIINEAKGGASTKTFPADRWDRARAAKPDYILIQFGHNDSHAKTNPESTDAAADYRENLRRYIAETRAIGAQPILVTPVRRRLFQANGAPTTELQPYADAMKAVAAELSAPVIDLYTLSGDLYQKLGEEGSTAFTMNQPDNADRPGKGDRTHFTEHGAREMARLVAQSLGGIAPRLNAALRTETSATAPTPAAKVDEQPVEKNVVTTQEPANDLPTLWIIGDSTVKTGGAGMMGWGDAVGPFFDTSKINLVNRAVGGRSTRTFLSEGRWDQILAQLRPGDTVIMQFGHNDASHVDEKPPVTSATRCRGSLRNNSDDTLDVFNILTNKPETVHSYGWYLRHFITTTKAKGADAIVCSRIPSKAWSADGKTIQRTTDSWTLWARQAAEQAGAHFIDLNEIIARAYEKIGPEAVEPLFADARTHTTPAGAAFNARAVVSGLNSLSPDPLAGVFSSVGREVPPFTP